MITKNCCARILVCVAAIGMIASPVVGATSATTTTASKSDVFDVKLARGRLLGQVVSAAGKPVAKADVVILNETTPIAKTIADELGRFAVPIEKSGVYRVAVAGRHFTIRAWQPKVAPPNAKTGILCVTEPAVRAQGLYGFHGWHGGKLKSILTNPVVLGVAVATAIAVPIALNDDDDAS